MNIMCPYGGPKWNDKMDNDIVRLEKCIKCDRCDKVEFKRTTLCHFRVAEIWCRYTGMSYLDNGYEHCPMMWESDQVKEHVITNMMQRIEKDLREKLADGFDYDVSLNVVRRSEK